MKRSMKTSMQGMILAFIMMPLIMMSQDRGTRELLPPTNLTGTVSDLNDVHLNWGGPDYGDPFWMHWDSGNNEDSWGFALNAAVYDIAAKWDPSDIDDYDDWKITGIRFFMTHDDANLTIKVWEGPSANEVYSQNVNSYQVNSWTEISFDTPVEIDVSTELWAGVEIDMPYGAYVVGMDDGPAEDEYGNLYRYQGNWYSDFNKNWNLQIEVSPPTSMQSPDGLLGYNIYRDSVKINDEVISGNSYVDKNLFNGTYDYFATSQYSGGESDSSNHVFITIDQPIILESDSLALVDLYNNCDGPNWSLNENWLESPLTDWYGINTTGIRVSDINLGWDDLTGGVPESFGNLTRLHSLIFSGNDISSLPSTFGELESLRTFEMNQSALTNLPENFGDLDSLLVLLLDHNEGISSLPASFGDMEQLEEFSMKDGVLIALPSSFGNLDNLYECYLNNNAISILPDNFGNLPSLNFLDMTGNQLTALPASFGNLGTLTEFTAPGNMLTELPAGFGNLSVLKVLDLNQNELTALPDGFSNLGMLQYLYLNDNNLTSLPDTLGDLDDLLVITAVNNQIVSLPESISDLEKIQTIEFGTNAIGNVPEYIGNLSSLGYLDLSENNISALPESIGDLNADILLLSSNDFADIPESMFDNTYQYLFVDDNSLQFGSIEPFIGNVSDEFAYTPQDNFGNDTTLYPETGTNFEFVLETTGEYNVYQWYKDGDILEGQTSDTLSFYEITEEDNGTYNLEVSNTLATELTLMSHIVIINTITTGVDEQPSGEITVYPNPVTGSTLGIRTGTTDPVRIQIINLTGRVLNEVVLTGVTSQIDISDLPDGLYLLKIYDNENTLNVVKFIKN